MDIEQFYDADVRRRGSVEVEFGQDWHDAQGVRYELSWIEDTGELYVMREPVPTGWATPFGGIHVWHAHSADEREIEGMTVGVLGTVAGRPRIEEVLSGWQDAEQAADGIAWLVDRLRSEGVLVAAREGTP